MEEVLKEIVGTYLIPAVVTLAGAFITWGVAEIKKIFKEKVKDEEVRRVVEDVVKFVERTLKTADNQQKFDTALTQASDWLEEKGIKVSATELKLLVEGAVNNLPKTQKGE